MSVVTEPSLPELLSEHPLSDSTGHIPARQTTRKSWQGIWNRFRVFLQRRVIEGIFLERQVERFYLVFGGHLFFQTLHAACRFDLFSLLHREPGLSRNQIAARLGISEQPARILLLGLTAAHLLKVRRGRYYNTLFTKELLTTQSSRNILPYVFLQHHVMYPGVAHLYESIREYRNVGLAEFRGNEPTIYERLSHEPEIEEVFHDAMSVLSTQTNQMLANFLDLRQVSHLVDVGGGDGTNLITLARRFPHLRGTVFDLPSVCEIARKKIRAAGLSDRIDTFEGNVFQAEFPKNADAFLFSHFFTIWSAEKDKELLRKAYAALPKHGLAIVFNMMQSDDESGPLSAAVGSPYFLSIATGEGMLYTWREYEQWMHDAGYSHVRRQVLPRDHGVIIGTK